MKVLLDINDAKVDLFMELMESISFVKKIERIENNEITHSQILQSISDYESGKVKPTPCNLSELKELLNV